MREPVSVTMKLATDAVFLLVKANSVTIDVVQLILLPSWELIKIRKSMENGFSDIRFTFYGLTVFIELDCKINKDKFNSHGYLYTAILKQNNSSVGFLGCTEKLAREEIVFKISQ